MMPYSMHSGYQRVIWLVNQVLLSDDVIVNIGTGFW